MDRGLRTEACKISSWYCCLLVGILLHHHAEGKNEKDQDNQLSFTDNPIMLHVVENDIVSLRGEKTFPQRICDHERIKKNTAFSLSPNTLTIWPSCLVFIPPPTPRSLEVSSMRRFFFFETPT